MYRVLLTLNNREFEEAVQRTSMHLKSTELKRVESELTKCRQNLNGMNLSALLQALYDWRTKNPKEYSDRGVPRGIGFRLWMEVKQMLRNNFGKRTAHPDPAMPPDCPGSLLGHQKVFVPPPFEKPDREICHAFSYRYLIASGRLKDAGQSAGTDGQFNATTMVHVFFPKGGAHYPAVRANGIMAVREGDLVGVFVGDVLNHSLIVVSSTVWFGANNLGTFGRPLGRTEVNLNQRLVGQWNGTGNLWKIGGKDLALVYRRLPLPD